MVIASPYVKIFVQIPVTLLLFFFNQNRIYKIAFYPCYWWIVTLKRERRRRLWHVCQLGVVYVRKYTYVSKTCARQVCIWVRSVNGNACVYVRATCACECKRVFVSRCVFAYRRFVWLSRCIQSHGRMQSERIFIATVCWLTAPVSIVTDLHASGGLCLVRFIGIWGKLAIHVSSICED